MQDISNSISDLYVSIKESYIELGRRNSWNSRRDPRQIVGKIIASSNAYTLKATELVDRLHSEMTQISDSVGKVAGQNMEVVGLYDMREDMQRYSMAWAKAVYFVELIFKGITENGKQMERFWKRTEEVIEGMTEGTDEGTALFKKILAQRLEVFGVDEIEDVLDEFVASKANEAEEIEEERKESEELKALDIARKGFKEVFEGLKKELEEVKKESCELRGELQELKERGN